MNRSCLRFLAENKNAGFWREKKRRNSQDFSAKMPEKISHFFGQWVKCGQMDKELTSNFDLLFPLVQEF